MTFSASTGQRENKSIPGSIVDLFIRIYPWDAQRSGYPVEARLSDGGEFPGVLQLDLVALRLAENKLDPVAYGMQLFDVLVELGLLERLEVLSGGAALYGLHPVVAAFAAVRLAERCDEEQEAGLAHARCYTTVVAGYDDAIRAGQMSYGAPYEWEQVARAVAWLAPRIEKDMAAAEALLAFTRNWRNVVLNNYDPRRARWLDLGVAAARRTGSEWDLANTLQAQGDVYGFLKRNDEALGVYGQALDLFRAVGSRLGEANTLQAQGNLALQAGDAARGLESFEQARDLYILVGDRVGPANTGITLANYAEARGDLAAAIAYLQPAAAFCLAIGHPLGVQLEAQIKTWQEQLDTR